MIGKDLSELGVIKKKNASILIVKNTKKITMLIGTMNCFKVRILKGKILLTTEECLTQTKKKKDLQEKINYVSNINYLLETHLAVYFLQY